MHTDTGIRTDKERSKHTHTGTRADTDRDRQTQAYTLTQKDPDTETPFASARVLNSFKGISFRNFDFLANNSC